MASRVSTLALASPLAVGRALAGDDPYRFGTPGDGLSVELAGVGEGVFRFTSDGTLNEGDVYVAPLNDWVDYFVGLGYASEVATLILAALGRGKRAKITLSILGYVPFRLTIPAKGSLVFSPHGKIVLRGVFGPSATAPVEEWSASMSYDIVGEDVGAMPATLDPAVLEDVSDAWAAVINYSGTYGEFSPYAFLTETAYYRAQADGTATGGVWQRHYRASAAAGQGTASDTNPIQVATVVTLDGFGPRGGRFGRFYLPALACAVGSGYRYPTLQVSTLLTNVVTALTTVNTVLSTALAADVELVIASGRGDGENRPVRQVKIGDVPDTMRSRRNNLVETYSEADFQAV